MWIRALLFRFLFKLYERCLGIFFEGPEPPKRLTDEIHLFVARYPSATKIEWIAFTSYITRSSYQQGYLRGYEAMERDTSTFPERHSQVLKAAEDDLNWANDLADKDVQVTDKPGPDRVSEQMSVLQNDFISKLRVRGRT